jgi:hypothetical protein
MNSLKSGMCTETSVSKYLETETKGETTRSGRQRLTAFIYLHINLPSLFLIFLFLSVPLPLSLSVSPLLHSLLELKPSA